MRPCPAVWFLTAEGDTAQHVYEVIAAGATDHEVMQHAIDRGAVIITRDTDFGALLVQCGRTEPSVILMRELLSLPVASQGRLLAANLDQVREVLITGAIVVFSLDDIRARPLPLAPHL
jgi:predicted nuclease of predicted toxin-antitoxin system